MVMRSESLAVLESLRIPTKLQKQIVSKSQGNSSASWPPSICQGVHGDNLIHIEQGWYIPIYIFSHQRKTGYLSRLLIEFVEYLLHPSPEARGIILRTARIS